MIERFYEEETLLSARGREDGRLVRVVAYYVLHGDKATVTNGVLALNQLHFEMLRFSGGF